MMKIENWDAPTALDLNLDDAPTLTLEPIGPTVLTGEAKNRVIKFDVSEGADNTFRMTCPDGTVLEIKPGKSKILMGRRDGRLHLLDCTCPVCLESREKARGDDAREV